MRPKFSIRFSALTNSNRGINIHALHICGSFENIKLSFSDWLNIQLAGKTAMYWWTKCAHTHKRFVRTPHTVHRTLLLLLNYLSTHNTNEGKRNCGEREHFYTSWFSQPMTHIFIFIFTYVDLYHRGSKFHDSTVPRLTFQRRTLFVQLLLLFWLNNNRTNFKWIFRLSLAHSATRFLSPLLIFNVSFLFLLFNFT